MINKMYSHLYRVAMATMLSIILLLVSGCDQSEIEGLASSVVDNSDGTPVEVSIRLGEITGYNNSSDGNAPATRSGEPLIAEWAKVNSFSTTRSGPDPNAPEIAAIELFEDTVPDAPQTRSVMGSGINFRVFLFYKNSSGNYVFQSVADYTSNGSLAPVLKQGSLRANHGQTVRFVAISYNSANSMGTLPTSVSWSTTKFYPNQNTDFMVYDSGDKPAGTDGVTVTIHFSHILCTMNITFKATGFIENACTSASGRFTNVYGKGKWGFGDPKALGTTSDFGVFATSYSGNATTVRLIADEEYRRMVINTDITIHGRRITNLSIEMSQSVALQRGKKYSLTVNLKKTMGVKLSIQDINVNGSGCYGYDKERLSKLRFGDGNLSGDGELTWKMMTTASQSGNFFRFNSYQWAGVVQSYREPCSLLHPSIYGEGWERPTKEDFDALARCAGIEKYVDGRFGRMFLNNEKGFFLPYELSTDGTQVSEGQVYRRGYYQSSTTKTNNNKGEGWLFEMNSPATLKTELMYAGNNHSFVVRCKRYEP